jgi:hypothetical protein
MPQAPNTPEQLQAIVDAVARYGSVSAASRALGMPDSTARNRHDAAKREGYRPGFSRAPAGITPPAIPPAHESVEEMIARRKAAFARKREVADARRWMRFSVEGGGPFALAFVGDPHADDDGCDLPRLEEHLATIEATSRMWGVGMGDWTNNWTGRLARLYAEQGTTASDAWRFAEWMLQRPIWLLLLRGNHDMWSGAGDPLRWITAGVAPLVDWSAQFEIACGEAVWRIEAAHDFPGSSIWNKLHAPLRKAKLSGGEADLYVAAHRHTFALAEEQDEHTGRVAWLARVRGYKALDSYAHVSGYGQQQDRGHSIVAVFSPETRGLRCFSDVAEGAEYLRFLQAPAMTVKPRAAKKG